MVEEEDAPRAFTGKEWFLQGPKVRRGKEWFLQGPKVPRASRRNAVKDALEKAFASGYTGGQPLQLCVAHNTFMLQPMPGAPFNTCEKWMVDGVYRAIKKQRLGAVENVLSQALMDVLAGRQRGPD